MSIVYFISDLHLGHKNILNFAGDFRDGDTIEEHDYILQTRWNLTVKKRDLVYVLGDVAFTTEKLQWFGETFNGRKILVRGNHDNLNEGLYRQYFEKILGLWKYKGFWLSHCPIHKDELRGSPSIHGHVHHNPIRDPYHQIDKRYKSVCVEANRGWPQTLDQIKDMYNA